MTYDNIQWVNKDKNDITLTVTNIKWMHWFYFSIYKKGRICFVLLWSALWASGLFSLSITSVCFTTHIHKMAPLRRLGTVGEGGHQCKCPLCSFPNVFSAQHVCLLEFHLQSLQHLHPQPLAPCPPPSFFSAAPASIQKLQVSFCSGGSASAWSHWLRDRHSSVWMSWGFTPMSRTWGLVRDSASLKRNRGKAYLSYVTCSIIIKWPDLDSLFYFYIGLSNRTHHNEYHEMMHVWRGKCIETAILL